MTNKIMSKTRFKEIIGAYGANAKHWPAAEQDSMRAFITENPDRTRTYCDQALKLELALDLNIDAGQHSQTDNTLLMVRILKEAQKTPQNNINTPANDTAITAFQTLPWKSLAATLLLAMGIGFGVGQVTAKTTDIEQAENFLADSSETLDSYTQDFSWIEDLS